MVATVDQKMGIARAMQIRRTISSNIIDFPDLDYGNAEIDAYIQEISHELGTDFLPDRTLVLRFVFGLGDWIGVIKRGIPYPSTKEKYMSIYISVPTTQLAPYGINKKRFLPRPTLKVENFYVLPVEWKNFSTLHDYLKDSAIRGVTEASKKRNYCGRQTNYLSVRCRCLYDRPVRPTTFYAHHSLPAVPSLVGTVYWVVSTPFLAQSARPLRAPRCWREQMCCSATESHAGAVQELSCPQHHNDVLGRCIAKKDDFGLNKSNHSSRHKDYPPKDMVRMYAFGTNTW